VSVYPSFSTAHIIAMNVRYLFSGFALFLIILGIALGFYFITMKKPK
jgi:hypothetical protein